MSELIDIYDENSNKIGVEDKDIAHAKGLWHKVFHCWILNNRDNIPKILFQVRAADKDFYPNAFDISAAGHIGAGETSVSAGIRELEEEVGVVASENDLIPLGLRLDSLRYKQMINNEYTDVFFLYDNRELEDYTLQASELDGITEIHIADAISLFSGETDSLTVSVIKSDKSCYNREFTRENIIPRTGNYTLTVLIMAERYFNSLTPLSI